MSAAVLLLLAGCGGPTGKSGTQMTGEPDAQTAREPERMAGETYPPCQTHGGCAVELKTVIPYSHRIHGIFGVTAPEGVVLSPLLAPGREAWLSLEGLSGEVVDGSGPRQGSYVSVSYEVADDGDGRENTIDVVVQAVPVTAQGEEGPFGPGNVCRISFEELMLCGSDGEQTTLASGDWQFTLDLTAADTEAVELLDGPVTTQALVLRIGDTEADTPAVEPVTLTSVRLDPLCVQIAFQKPGPVETLVSVFLDQTMFGPGATEQEEAHVVMEDGRQIRLFQANGAVDIAILQADSPIDLDRARALRFPDGTELEIFIP